MLLTLQAVGVQEVLALFVTFNTALHTSHSLSSDAPEKTFAFVAVGRRCSSPGDEIVRSSRRYRIDHRLQGFLVHVHLLRVYHCDSISSISREKILDRKRGGRKGNKGIWISGLRKYLFFYFGLLLP